MHKKPGYKRFKSIDDFMARRNRADIKNLEICCLDGYDDALRGIENCHWLENLKIDCSNRTVNINSIHGIEYCSSLIGLEIQGNDDKSTLIDLTPLTHLTSLRWLILREINVSTLSGINLPKLERLRLTECYGFSNLEILAGLRVITLLCTYCGLNSLQGLNLSRLVFLSVAGNDLTSIKELEDAEYLETLYICNNKITCLDPVGKLFSKGTLSIIKAHESYRGDNLVLQALSSEECPDECFFDLFDSQRTWPGDPLDLEDNDEDEEYSSGEDYSDDDSGQDQ